MQLGINLCGLRIEAFGLIVFSLLFSARVASRRLFLRTIVRKTRPNRNLGKVLGARLRLARYFLVETCLKYRRTSDFSLFAKRIMCWNAYAEALEHPTTLAAITALFPSI